MQPNAPDMIKLSRVISSALRHEPWLYELELDECGGADLEQLLEVLRREPTWATLTPADISDMISHSEKKRHEIKNGRIRALYGHSLAGKLLMERAEPPAALYHGTAQVALKGIMTQGLQPMGRQYVHLSRDRRTAEQVGRRKADQPFVLTIRAKEAYDRGTIFYRGNDVVWLADRVAPEYIDGP